MDPHRPMPSPATPTMRPAVDARFCVLGPSGAEPSHSSVLPSLRAGVRQGMPQVEVLKPRAGSPGAP